MEYVKRDETLCWSCEHACGGCSWSDDLVPVKGWVAQSKPIHVGRTQFTEARDEESYFVFSCPRYKKEPDVPKDERRSVARGAKASSLSLGGMVAMMEACLALAGKDYINDVSEGHKERREITAFLKEIAPERSKAMLKFLKAEALKHDTELEEKYRSAMIEAAIREYAEAVAGMHGHLIHGLVFDAWRDLRAAEA